MSDDGTLSSTFTLLRKLPISFTLLEVEMEQVHRGLAALGDSKVILAEDDKQRQTLFLELCRTDRLHFSAHASSGYII